MPFMVSNNPSLHHPKIHYSDTPFLQYSNMFDCLDSFANAIS